MKSLSAIAKELGVSVATVSYVYHDKWRENRIHPDLAERVRRKLALERGAPDTLGRQLQSGRTQTVGLLLPHLDQPYFLNLLAGVERTLSDSDYMVLLGIAHEDRAHRQVDMAERMLARRVDALLMCPRPADALAPFVASVGKGARRPIVFVDNYLPKNSTPSVVSDNRWAAEQAVAELIERGRRRVLFLGGNPAVAALQDRCAGYRDALLAAGIKPDKSWIVWRDAGDETAVAQVRKLLQSNAPPDALLATSFFRLLPFLRLFGELGLCHPRDIWLAGFDEPLESWPAETVRHVVQEPLWIVQQNAAEMGRLAVELALTAVDGQDILGRQHLVRPALSWRAATS